MEINYITVTIVSAIMLLVMVFLLLSTIEKKEWKYFFDSGWFYIFMYPISVCIIIISVCIITILTRT